MKKTLLIVAAGLFSLNFVIPQDASAQFWSGRRERVSRILDAVSNGMRANNGVQSTTQSNLPVYFIPSGGTVAYGPGVVTNPQFIQGGNTSHQSINGGNTLVNPYTGGTTQTTQTFGVARTAVAVENHSHQPLTVYIRWNGGTPQPFQIQPQQVLVKSMTGHNQRAELLFHEDLTGANQVPKTVPLTGTNVTLNRAPVASDVQWAKQLHVDATQNRVVAQY